MDYAEQLRREIRDAHAVFHQFVLALSVAEATTFFFFFEGDEDPAFYMPHIASRIGPRKYHTFICYGRSEVIKVNELVERDGRGPRRTLFFVDKDHTDLVGPGSHRLASNVYQTDYYSIESYLACEEVFRRFWVERLHLLDLDSRFDRYLALVAKSRLSFEKRCRSLMALVLIGRGIDGGTPAKLNLNNVQLDKVIKIDFEAGTCRFQTGGLRHFLRAANFELCQPAPTLKRVKAVVRQHLTQPAPKTFIRGKYELWHFWKLLVLTTRELSDRARARQAGMRRATPTFPMGMDCAVESLAPFVPCPPTLQVFLNRTISA